MFSCKLRAEVRILVFGIGFVSCFPLPALADLLSSASASPGLLTCDHIDGSSYCTLSGTALSFENGFPYVPIELSGNLNAIATYGHLGITVNLNGATLVDAPHVSATAQFSDTLYVGGFTGPGFVQYTFNGGGTIGTFPFGSAFFLVNIVLILFLAVEVPIRITRAFSTRLLRDSLSH